MDAEEEQYIKALEKQTADLENKNLGLNTAVAASNFQTQEDKNLIEFQLETSEMLSRIQHSLKGDYVSTDVEGNEIWVTQKDKKLVLLNSYGVDSIMSIIGLYIDKNTILSRYDEMRINEILADIGDEINKFIFCNYETMGMDTDRKKTRYELLVLSIIHTIESAYRKALNAETSRILNTSTIFTQSDIRSSIPSGAITNKKKFNLFRPRTW